MLLIRIVFEVNEQEGAEFVPTPVKVAQLVAFVLKVT